MYDLYFLICLSQEYCEQIQQSNNRDHPNSDISHAPIQNKLLFQQRFSQQINKDVMYNRN